MKKLNIKIFNLLIIVLTATALVIPVVTAENLTGNQG